MDGYSEIGAIYFSVGESTSFAKFENGKIIADTYMGAPPYKSIKGKVPFLLRQFHAAEHQVYNCFMNKAKKLKYEADFNQLALCIPSLDEVEHTSPVSLFCGTTVFLMFGIVLILSAIPNMLRFHNTDFWFMLIWLVGTIVFAITICMWIQRKFFLAKPTRHQLRLALEALKEVFRHGTVTS